MARLVERLPKVKPSAIRCCKVRLLMPSSFATMETSRRFAAQQTLHDPFHSFKGALVRSPRFQLIHKLRREHFEELFLARAKGQARGRLRTGSAHRERIYILSDCQSIPLSHSHVPLAAEN